MIDEAASSDAAAIIALWEACGLTRPSNPPKADLARALDGPSSTILISRVAGVIVGSIMVGHDGHRGWVYYVAVAPDARRGGIGRALMEAAEVWLRARGAPQIQFMVREGNDDARSFYEALGYPVQPVAVLGRMLDP